MGRIGPIGGASAPLSFALIVAPVGLGWMFFWGLLANMIALDLYLFALPSLDRFCERLVRATGYRGIAEFECLRGGAIDEPARCGALAQGCIRRFGHRTAQQSSPACRRMRDDAGGSEFVEPAQKRRRVPEQQRTVRHHVIDEAPAARVVGVGTFAARADERLAADTAPRAHRRTDAARQRLVGLNDHADGLTVSARRFPPCRHARS